MPLVWYCSLCKLIFENLNKLLIIKLNFYFYSYFTGQSFVDWSFGQSLWTRVTSANFLVLMFGCNFAEYLYLNYEFWQFYQWLDSPSFKIYNWHVTPLWDMWSVYSLVRYVECLLPCDICGVFTPLWYMWSVYSLVRYVECRVSSEICDICGLPCEICEICGLLCECEIYGLWDMWDMWSVDSIVRYAECGLPCEICEIFGGWTSLWDMWDPWTPLLDM